MAGLIGIVFLAGALVFGLRYECAISTQSPDEDRASWPLALSVICFIAGGFALGLHFGTIKIV